MRDVVILLFNILGPVRVNPNWLDNLEKQEVDIERPYCLYIKRRLWKRRRNLKWLKSFFCGDKVHVRAKSDSRVEKT